uniref:C-type lectin domain family 4 member E-like n=1 Tax=Mastacembelus armatus TaxID=205130 RepID=A0A3Q3SUR2_9TELE
MQCSATEVSAVKNNLTELLQASYDKILSLFEERDLLRTISKHMENNLTELRAQLTAMTEKSDWPSKCYISLHTNCLMMKTNLIFSISFFYTEDRCCPAGWKMFGRTCYLLSVDSGSWDKGRQDCRDRGADLVVIDSREEQVFLSDLAPVDTWSWIGLTDKEVEGTWKWIDGSSLTTSYWDANQPDNGGGDPNCGEEDCAHIQTGKKITKNWNDLSCDASLRWICEKMA